jgi:hypothetical protein
MTLTPVPAQMAELVDALDSKSGSRKGVQVRFLFWALITGHSSEWPFSFYNNTTTFENQF